MKNRTILAVILGSLILLISFSKEAASIEEKVSIIGNWKAIKEVSVCTTGSKLVNVFNLFEHGSRITFFEDETFNSRTFKTINGDCEEDTANRQWSLGEDRVTATMGEDRLILELFALTNTSFQIGYYIQDPENTCEEGNKSARFYKERIRIK